MRDFVGEFVDGCVRAFVMAFVMALVDVITHLPIYIINYYVEVLEKGFGFDEGTLQVTAVLLVTVFYQAALSPPAPIWNQDMKLDYRCMIHHAKASLQPPPTADCPTPAYLFFMLFNSVGFFCSIMLLLLHKTGRIAQALMVWSILSLMISYFILFVAISPDGVSCLVVVITVLCVLIIFYLLNRVMSKMRTGSSSVEERQVYQLHCTKCHQDYTSTDPGQRN